MKIGQVVGALWATKKVPELVGIPFLLVRTEETGGTFAAADAVGAGPGDWVLVTTGSGARGEEKLPIDAKIVGIVDARREDAAGGGEQTCQSIRQSFT